MILKSIEWYVVIVWPDTVGVFDNFYVLSSSSWKSWHPFYKEIDGRLEVPEDGLYIVYGQVCVNVISN